MFFSKVCGQWSIQLKTDHSKTTMPQHLIHTEKKKPVYSENIFGKSDPDPKSTGFSNFFLGYFVLSV